MADVSDDLKDWSTTASSNSPSGSSTIGTGLDDNLREIQKVVRQDLAHKGADIASAATTDLGAVPGLYHDITGTTTVTGFGTVSAGIWKFLQFDGAVPLVHNTTSLGLPGDSDITTEAGDHALAVSLGSGNWVVPFYQRASLPPTRPVLETSKTTTSGTAVSFTSIPSWVKRITVMISALSTSGTDDLLLQIGDSGGMEDSGYVGVITRHGSTSNAGATFSAGFDLMEAMAATRVIYAVVELVLMNASSNTWMAKGVTAATDLAFTAEFCGFKSLSATLDRLQITTSGGTDTFDAGSINIQYE